MRYLLDTNVISEFRKPHPNPNVLAWLDQVDSETVYLSVITVGELQKGIARLPDEKRRRSLQTWLEDDLLVRFAGRIASLDVEVMLRWGSLLADLERTGKMMPAVDSLIAATAIHGGFVIVTRNESDFVHSGVAILNPWQ
jgi:predicted nucleic acid-binding protein